MRVSDDATGCVDVVGIGVVSSIIGCPNQCVFLRDLPNKPGAKLTGFEVGNWGGGLLSRVRENCVG